MTKIEKTLKALEYCNSERLSSCKDCPLFEFKKDCRCTTILLSNGIDTINNLLNLINIIKKDAVMHQDLHEKINKILEE